VASLSRSLDRIEVTFDEPNLVANAGLLLVATLVAYLGLERLINTTLDLSGRVGGAAPGRKVPTLVHALVAGGSHIDHADVLRAGVTGAVLSHRVMAPSTLGTYRTSGAVSSDSNEGRLLPDLNSAVTDRSDQLWSYKKAFSTTKATPSKPAAPVTDARRMPSKPAALAAP
jgi:hypothetical protein